MRQSVDNIIGLVIHSLLRVKKRQESRQAEQVGGPLEARPTLENSWIDAILDI